MTVPDFQSCDVCARDLPHDCNAERSLIALIGVSELYARRIVPRLQTTDFLDAALRGAFAQMQTRWFAVPNGVHASGVLNHCEADPQSVDRYVEMLKTRSLQRQQINAFGRGIDTVYRRPMTKAELLRLVALREAPADISILDVA